MYCAMAEYHLQYFVHYTSFSEVFSYSRKFKNLSDYRAYGNIYKYYTFIFTLEIIEQ